MSIGQDVEKSYSAADFKTIYEWIRKRLGGRREDELEELRNGVGDDNSYNPRYIVKLLLDKNLEGKAHFYFQNKDDYITLSTNGQINAISREDGLFKPWGVSEFRDLNPQSIFRQLEYMIREIRFLSLPERADHCFNSYAEFMKWLVEG